MKDFQMLSSKEKGDLKRSIIALKESGRTYPEISKQLNWGYTTVVSIVKGTSWSSPNVQRIRAFRRNCEKLASGK